MCGNTYEQHLLFHKTVYDVQIWSGSVPAGFFIILLIDRCAQVHRRSYPL